jgi:hypothetical protein
MFQPKKINEAIIKTYLDLKKGFEMFMGERYPYMADPKFMENSTRDLLAMAKGEGTNEIPFDYDCSTYGDCLTICKIFAEKCDSYQKEMTLLIIEEILYQWEKMKWEVKEGKRLASIYLFPLEKGNRWGNLMIALMESFGYELKKEQAVALQMLN